MTLKKLVLGSAAVLGSASVAQAADFIVPIVEPVNYVTYCDANGDTGINLSSNTCFRISGWARFQADFGANTWNPGTNTVEDAADWRFTSSFQLDMLATRNSDYGWIEAFISIQGSSSNNRNDTPSGAAAADRAVTLRRAWVRYGWLLAGYDSSIYGGISSAGYAGARTVDQIRATFGSGTTLAIALEDPRDRATEANPASGAFPDVTAALNGSVGPFTYRLAAGYGDRTVADVWGILASATIGVGTGGNLRGTVAYGRNGYDFVTSESGDPSGPLGAYWAYGVGYQQIWNPMWRSTIEWTQKSGPAPSDGEQRLRFAGEYRPLATTEFVISKQIDLTRAEALGGYSGQPWEVTGWLRLQRNFPAD